MSYTPAFDRPWIMKGMLGFAVAGREVDGGYGVASPGMSWTGGTSSTLDCANDHSVWSALYRVPC
jgi:hypothetical protein